MKPCTSTVYWYIIQVEFSKDFGDKTKPRAWSKYSSESSANEKKVQQIDETTDNSKALIVSLTWMLVLSILNIFYNVILHVEFFF